MKDRKIDRKIEKGKQFTPKLSEREEKRGQRRRNGNIIHNNALPTKMMKMETDKIVDETNTNSSTTQVQSKSDAFHSPKSNITIDI